MEQNLGKSTSALKPHSAHLHNGDDPAPPSEGPGGNRGCGTREHGALCLAEARHPNVLASLTSLGSQVASKRAVSGKCLFTFPATYSPSESSEHGAPFPATRPARALLSSALHLQMKQKSGKYYTYKVTGLECLASQASAIASWRPNTYTLQPRAKLHLAALCNSNKDIKKSSKSINICTVC